MKEKYQIYSTTGWCYFIQYAFSINTLFIVCFIAIIYNDIFLTIVSVISGISFVIGIYYLVRNYFHKPVEVTISDERINFKYFNIKRTKIKKEISIAFDEIDGFADMLESNDYNIKFFLKNGTWFLIYYDPLWQRKNDFYQLLIDLKIQLKEYNRKQEITKNNSKIKSEYINYFLGFSIIFFGFSGLCAISFIFSIFSEDDEGPEYKILLGTTLFLIAGVVSLIKHKRNKIKRDKNKFL